MTDYTDISKMPEWPKQMACDKANAHCGNVCWEPADIVPGNAAITELAIMCWQFCEEPVDPDLLIAREAIAQWCARTNRPNLAIEYRNGYRDEETKIFAAYEAVRPAREQGVR